ncbi:MAG: hypothetical protein N2C14_09760, partial [Planctomycetales bacterium]
MDERSPESPPAHLTYADTDADLPEYIAPRPRRFKRWVRLSVLLFIATCFTAYYSWWYFLSWRWTFNSGVPANWHDGLLYAGALLLILMTHEM